MNWFRKILSNISGKNDKETSVPDLKEQKTLQTNSEEKEIELNDDYLISLEEKLLRMDCGLEFSEYILNKLKKSELWKNKYAKASEIEDIVKNICTESLKEAGCGEHKFDESFQIVMITGVNGSGKTTSIGKLANILKKEGKKVLIAPCDTFRAAAREQLETWAERAGVEIHIPLQGEKQRPDSVLFEAIERAKENSFDILLVDTAGRLQNKRELMDELAKLSRVIDKHAPKETKIERWLVLDSTTGQNGYQQALGFSEVGKLTGIILTKFDGSAKAGIAFSICHNLKIPIKFIGTGESIDKLKAFDIDEFIEDLQDN